ncbi:MAG TPA: DNA polymerase III subunit alpha, partial [Dermatophilaceae bacterium]|nr:DNA polymerase III subunit alpha [Dermatophilaceae bacterium]
MNGFVHLHVASGFSMRYGASTPAALVARAAGLDQPALALTDRDGLYGAVRFVQACDAAGIAPILGVDLALGPTDGVAQGEVEDPASHGRDAGLQARIPRSSLRNRRQPVRGGLPVDPRLPRVTVLARGRLTELAAGTGWARLCRLVTATHLRGQRGRPVTSAQLVASHAGVPDGQAGRAAPRTAPAALTVLLGPDSDVGRALLTRRHAHAQALLTRWLQLLPDGAVAIEVVCHGGPDGSAASLSHARRLWRLGVEVGVPCVLTAAVRHAEPGDAATVDLLDAARRLVPLDVRHLDRTTTAGHLAPAARMLTVATQVTGDSVLARQLLDSTVRLAMECVQGSRLDLGVGSVQLPEPGALGLPPGHDPQQALARRCHAALPRRYSGVPVGRLDQIQARLDDELSVIAQLGYAPYFLTVAVVCDLIRDMGVRVAARGSGAGCVVNYLLGISGVEPVTHGLLMERFLTPLRAQLPDIDIDVESARRTEIYQRILERFGGERVTCVSMMDTYRVRHAIRDVGAALGLLPMEIDAIAKAFPHIPARDARHAIRELPELRRSGLGTTRLAPLFDLVERLDGLPRHIAVHPCGVILSNTGLLDRTPVEASWMGFPMSQFDKDDVETLGLLKLDVLGIRMQSAMAHAVAEITRVDGQGIDLDDPAQVPLDDETTFDLIRSTRTLGCFQIESPGQRELVGKFAPATFDDLIIDISLFRPGPVKSDMITPFLQARQGWTEPDLLHPSLGPALAGTHGVVVFHEQVLQIIATTTGISLAEADEVRRALGSTAGQDRVRSWWRPLAVRRGYAPVDIERIWEVLKAFASFGFCKAHAAAFALPTYQSAWLKAHHPAAFLAGVLTHDPGMYPKRLILDDARNFGIPILGLDVNRSGDTYRVELVEPPDGVQPPVQAIRLSLIDVKGIGAGEVQAVVAGQPFAGLDDFWRRTQVSRPVVERLILTGGFDALYGMDVTGIEGLGRRGRVTRRDLLLHLGELDRWSRSTGARTGGSRAISSSRPGGQKKSGQQAPAGMVANEGQADQVEVLPPVPGGQIRADAAAQSQAPLPATPAARRSTQLVLDLGDAPRLTPGTGLPEMGRSERIHAELDILGLDVSEHVLTSYRPMLDALGVTRSGDIRSVRSRREVMIAGVKVATQTPPVRSGRRVIFLTLDDATGPVDATFFEDVQGPYAVTVFHSWMLLVRGIVRRTGRRGLSIRATGAWELSRLWEAWTAAGAGGPDARCALWEALAEADREAVDLAAASAAALAEPYAGSPGGPPGSPGGSPG